MAVKSPNHPSMRNRASSTPADTDAAINPLMKKFIDDLVKSGAAKVLTKEESEAILASTEFDGCIARPKGSTRA